MKFRKLFVLLFVCLLGVMLVACGGSKETGGKGGKKKDDVDPLIPTSITIKVKTAKVQINTELKMTYVITPATAQNDKVTVTVDKEDLATAAVEGNNNIKLTAKDKIGNVKVTVQTSNGIKASKTIKVQEEAVESYPDLSGYAIRLAQAEHALGYYDVKLTKETEEKYDYYDWPDRDYRSQAWDEIEDNYNCTLNVVAYPSDAPWGPSRWQYILTQAQNETPDYDFYVVPESQIPGFVAGNAIVDLTDWYAQYGQSLMTEMSITAGTYKQRLYSINAFDMDVYFTIGYNVELWEKIHEYDSSIKEPAQMFLDNEWDFDNFQEYCIKVQTALNTMYSEETYYCLSGYGTYYWAGMVNASGVKILDVTQLKDTILGNVEAQAADALKNIFANGAMDPAFGGDQNVTSWNNGHSLFNTGELWFFNAANRWNDKLWGEDHTKYGYVPFPYAVGTDTDHAFCGTVSEACIVMASNRDWAYRGFGDECNAENIYKAVLDYYNTAKKYYLNNPEYDRATDLSKVVSTKFASEASIKAYLRVVLGQQQADGTYAHGIEEDGFFDPFNNSSVVSSTGNSGTFAGSINSYIKGTGASQWVDAVGEYVEAIDKALIDKFG